MLINDPVYGLIGVEEPVLIDLLNSDAIQRLNGVLQHGITGLIGVTRATTRLEHSLGVMHLVQRLGGSLEEQIAGLLHDASHTAFSHVIDYVFNAHETQHYHDEKKAAYLGGTDLPAVLARHGYRLLDLIDETRFPLLEQPAPRLCADRLDYFFRDSLDLGLATSAEIVRTLEHLVVFQGRIVVDNLEVARWMGDTYLATDDASWANFREVGLYELTAQAIRRGLELEILDDGDIWSVDQEMWTKLQLAQDPALIRQLQLISPKTRFIWDENSPDFLVSTKLRTIDPDVLYLGELRLLSEVDAEFAKSRIAYLERKKGKWPVRVIESGDPRTH